MESIPLIDKETFDIKENAKNLSQFVIDGNDVKVKQILSTINSSTKNSDAVNRIDSKGQSLLHYATKFNRLSTMKLLVEVFGGNVFIKNTRGESLLHFSSKYSRKSKLFTSDSIEEDELPSYTYPPMSEMTRESLNEITFDHLSTEYPNKLIGRMKQAKFEENCIDEMIFYLIDKGVDIYTRDEKSFTPIKLAIIGNNLKAFMQLVARENDIKNVLGEFQYTLLHEAMSSSNINFLKILLYKNFPSRVQDQFLNTPLHIGAKSGNIENLYFYLNHLKTQELTLKKDYENSPTKLMESAKKELTFDEILNAQNNQGETALHLAIISKNPLATILLLREGARVDLLTKKNENSLHLAAKTGDDVIFKLVLLHFTDVNAKNSEGMSPLHFGVLSRSKEICTLLKDKGAKLSAINNDAKSPLCMAAENNIADIMKVLISFGASVETIDKYSKTPLILAAENNSNECVKVLLQMESAKRSLNKSDYLSNTALHYAVRNDNLEMVELLIKAQANVNQKNDEGVQSLHLAAKHCSDEMINLLCSNNASIVARDYSLNSPLHHSAIEGNLNAFQSLINSAASLDAINIDGQTPFMAACVHGHLKIVQYCLENNLFTHEESHKTTPPIHLAAKFGNTEVVRELLKYNHDPTTKQFILKKKKYLNALDYAIEANSLDCASVLVNSNYFPAIMKNLYSKDETVESPMRKLIRKMPDVAKQVLDRCITFNDYPKDHDQFMMTYNFELLDDTFECPYNSTLSDKDVYQMDDSVETSVGPFTLDRGVIFKNHPLNIMVEEKRKELIEHDLVVTLLKKKWKSFGILLYFSNLFLYLTYLILFTGLMIFTRQPHNYVDNLEPDTGSGKFIILYKIILILICAFNLLKECFQLINRRLSYFKDFENIIEVFLFTSTIVIALHLEENDGYPTIKSHSIWQLTGATIFIAWLNFVLFIKKTPKLGIYVILFTKVAKTFTKFFTIFTIFILTYGITFYILFSENDAYKTPSISIFKTLVMSTGELDFGDLFNHDTWKMTYPQISYMIYVTFIILINIIIMNLLVGLAVDDIKSVLDESRLNKLSMQITLCLEIESALTTKYLRKNIQRSLRFFPNSKISSFKRLFIGFLIPKISGSSSYEEEEKDRLTKSISALSDEIEELKRTNLQILTLLTRHVRQEDLSR